MEVDPHFRAVDSNSLGSLSPVRPLAMQYLHNTLRDDASIKTFLNLAEVFNEPRPPDEGERDAKQQDNGRCSSWLTGRALPDPHSQTYRTSKNMK